MKKTIAAFFWLLVALLGAAAYTTIALRRNEPINSAYLVIAAVCTYAIGHRFYSKWIAARILTLNDRRATPCVVHDDGRDFVKTNKFIVFGHHFAAIAGPGPLVGPVLAAQFGYLPGALWILIGAALGGAVQDFVILLCSIRHDGKSLEWILLLSRRKPAVLHETEPVWLPEYAVKEAGPSFRTAAGAAVIAFGLVKELSVESYFERARQQACACAQTSNRQIFALATEERFNGIRRCC